MGKPVTPVNMYDDSVIWPSSLNTYSAAATGYTLATGPTDTWTIKGSASKIVKVYRVFFSTVQTTAAVNRIVLLRRSTANSAGAAETNVALDPNSPAATAVVERHTGNPTTGSLVGNIWSGYYASPVVTTAGVAGVCGITLDFVAMFGKPIILSGVAQTLCVNLGGATLTGALGAGAFVWSEE